MKLSYIYSFGNKGNTLVAQDILTDSLPHQANTHNIHKYLTPDYFLPSSHSNSYYSKKYSSNHTASTINSITHKNVANHAATTISQHHSANTIVGIKPIYQSKSSKISRVASVMLLSLSFLATALEVKAQPSLNTSVPTSPYTAQSLLQQQEDFHSPLQQHTHFQPQQPKKKPLLKRAAHKVAKRLGFRGVVAATREPEISMEELKELYIAEYGESMDATIARGVTADGTASYNGTQKLDY